DRDCWPAARARWWAALPKEPAPRAGPPHRLRLVPDRRFRVQARQPGRRLAAEARCHTRQSLKAQRIRMLQRRWPRSARRRATGGSTKDVRSLTAKTIAVSGAPAPSDTPCADVSRSGSAKAREKIWHEYAKNAKASTRHLG